MCSFLNDDRKDNWLVTGGAGFLGSHFVCDCRDGRNIRVCNLDRLTSAGSLDNLERLRNDQDHLFIRGDIRNRALLQRILHEYMPEKVIHLAAECQPGASAPDPDMLMRTNVFGTYSVLEEVSRYWTGLESGKRKRFRFLNVSTAEVYGSLGARDDPHTESSPYAPRTLYAATKAAGDHLVRSYHRTFGFPALIANSTESYGPCQLPERPIAALILRIMGGSDSFCGRLPTSNFLHVEDQCRALRAIIEKGRVGETYHIGGDSEMSGEEMAEVIHHLLKSFGGYSNRETSVRHAHSFSGTPPRRNRCVLNISKIRNELGWKPMESFESGMRKTLRWFLENMDRINGVKSGIYRARGS